MSKNYTQDWMEKLVKNYKVPEETPKQKKEPARLLKESQLKIIMNRDKPNNTKK
jgi:hypothetical protein